MEAHDLNQVMLKAARSNEDSDYVLYIRELCGRYVDGGPREIEEEVEGLLGEGRETFGLEKILNELEN